MGGRWQQKEWSMSVGNEGMPEINILRSLSKAIKPYFGIVPSIYKFTSSLHLNFLL